MLRNIEVWPSPVLSIPCPAVDFAAMSAAEKEDLKTLLNDMADTMLAARGAGLAAPQVGQLIRAIVILVKRPNPAEGEPPYEIVKMVNPTILERNGKQQGREGCLSLPNYFDEISRANWVKVRALDENGAVIEIEGDGFLARAIQHEIEHLDGIVFVDHLSVLKRNRAHAKFSKAKRKGMRYMLDEQPQDIANQPS